MDAPTSRTGSLASLARFLTATDTLWSRIAAARPQGQQRSILFLGTEHDSGTSTAACCAAIGLARNLRARVLLVELGLGTSSLAKLVGLPEGPGLYELLCKGASLEGCVHGSEIEGLGIVTAGRGRLPPGDLASAGAKRTFEQLAAGRDYVIIDAPPIQDHPELQPILMHAQEAVLVFEAEQTRRDRAHALVQIVERAGLQVLGSVLNRARSPGFLS